MMMAITVSICLLKPKIQCQEQANTPSCRYNVKKLLVSQPPFTDCNNVWLLDDALALPCMQYSAQCMVSTMLQATPGGIVCSWIMILNVCFLSDCHSIATGHWYIAAQKQKDINYDYHIGQKYLTYNNSIKAKLESKIIGPIKILRVHSNRTVT